MMSAGFSKLKIRVGGLAIVECFIMNEKKFSLTLMVISCYEELSPSHGLQPNSNENGQPKDLKSIMDEFFEERSTPANVC